nr:hypothetical protein [Lachnospiraceae bacterium]
MICSRKNERNRLGSKVQRFLRAALLLVLCVCLTGCSTILGTGEITVVTAPPIVTPRVIVYDAGANGSKTRYDIEGTDAFYLLPGIENLPEKMQDFNCLDYTDDGSFVYYYCAPAYITAEEVAALKGTDGTAPGGAYPEIDRSNASETDAMIFMKYNPKTRAYHVLDAQPYSHTTANSETGGEANTGVDFYASGVYSFYTLSHCYGCRLSGQHRYFIFDQNGTATVYDDAGRVLSQTSIGDLITAKVQETANELNLAAKQKADSSKGAGINDAGKEMTDAVKELEGATGKTYDTGASGNSDIVLNCLIKSAVMDGGGVIYLTLMLYTGESPWASETMLNRVINISSFDLGGDMIKFISTN